MSDSPPAPRPNGARALATLGRFLADDGWTPRPDGLHAFAMDYRSGGLLLAVRAELLVDAEQLVVSAQAPTPVPEHRRMAALEYLARAGWGLFVGSFQLDLETGSVRACCGLDFEGEPLSPRLIRNALAVTIHLMEVYLSGLDAVIAGDEPRAALARAEANDM